MTKADDIQRLVERIEGASGLDRRLNADILIHLGWTRDDHDAFDPRGQRATTIPNYVGSMDDVRTLIDPSDEWELSTIYNIARATVGLNRDHQTAWPGYGEHQGGDPVLALLAAALRARITERTDDDA